MNFLFFTFVIAIISGTIEQLPDEKFLKYPFQAKKVHDQMDDNYECPKYENVQEITDGGTYSGTNIYSCSSTYTQSLTTNDIQVFLFNCIIEGQEQSLYGGAFNLQYDKISLDKDDSNIIEKCKFTKCIASKGGAIYINGKNTDGTPLTIRNCEFILNKAQTGGGALCFESAIPTITGCKFINNTSGTGSKGHDISYLFSIQGVTSRNFVLKDNVFQHEFTDAGGSLIYVDSRNKQLTINCPFSDNKVNLTGQIGKAYVFNFFGTTTKTSGFEFKGNSLEPFDKKYIAPSDFTLNLDFTSDGNDFHPLWPAGPNCTIEAFSEGFLNPCRRSVSDSINNVFITVVRSTFSKFTNSSNGGAIYAKNYFVNLNENSFIQCTSANGAGGAIYAHNSLNNGYDILIENCHFTECQALYGGAVYVYSNNVESSVVIKLCRFISNHLTKSDSGSFKGGSGIYLAAINSNVMYCKFRFNDEESFKIDTIENANDVRSLSSNKISVVGCEFNDPKKSIFYLSRKGGSHVEIERCNFKGKMADGSYYIGGVLTAKKEKKIHIRNCMFSNEKLIAENEDLIDFSMPVEHSNSSKMMNIGAVFEVSTCAALLLFIALFKKMRSNKTENNDYDDKSEI